MMPYLKRKIIPLSTFAIVASTIAGFYAGEYIQKESIKKIFYGVRQIRLPTENYPLVSRLIGSELPNATKLGFYDDLYSQINSFVDNRRKTSPLKDFSFYFRDLNSGMWFGMNENEEDVPASLFKLPIAITYYKDSTLDREILNKTYVYTKEIDSKLDTQIGLQKSGLTIGNSYKVSDLIDEMLIDSDNGAKNILAENINLKTLNTLFDLVQLPDPAQNDYFISPKEYSFFLRMLYNGSYLGQEKSQAILSILSKASFDEGIRKAVPQDITVVHKFGSVNLTDKKTSAKMIGFRDCGIIYYPQKPFILCFMLSGDDQEELAKDVETITGYFIDNIQKNKI